MTEATIRELASIKGERAPITSCYLDVDGRRLARQRDLEHEVDVLLKDARAKADGEASVFRDLGASASTSMAASTAPASGAWRSSPAGPTGCGRSSSCRCPCTAAS
jgi:hypothetical protein